MSSQIKINAGDAEKQNDTFLVNPDEIVVSEVNRGRWTPPTEEQIRDRAVSMIEITQLQPVECRRVEWKETDEAKPQKNVLELVLGFTRWSAACLIRQGFTHKGQSYHNPEFKLLVRVVDSEPKDAFVRNIHENVQRNATSPIDDAYNQQRLRNEYGLKDAEIARVYGYKAQTTVGRLKKLLDLSDKEKKLVHEGKLSVQAAIDLLGLTQEEREKVLEEARKGKDGEKINGRAVTAKVREKALEEAEKPAVEANGTSSDAGQEAVIPRKPNEERVRTARPLTIKEVRDFAASLKNDESETLKKFGENLLGFVTGVKSEKAMRNAIAKLTTG
jgi:ParB-like chromosome segregation protein Spo0J